MVTKKASRASSPRDAMSAAMRPTGSASAWTSGAMLAYAQMNRPSDPVTWLVRHVVSPIDRASFRLTRGRLRLSAGRPVLLLSTTGRRTGRARTTPVFYIHDGQEDVVVCNARPPGERANPWPMNLDHQPEIEVTYEGRTRPMLARRATEAEIERLWPMLVDVWPRYAAYFAATNERHVFVLHPRPGPASAAASTS